MAAFDAAGALLTGATSSTAPVPVPAGVSSGKFVCVSIYTEADPTIAPPDGSWSQIGVEITAQTLIFQNVFWKIASGNDSGTYTFGLGSSMYRLGIAASVTSVDLANPIDDFDQQTGGGGTSNTSMTTQVDTTVPNSTLLWFPCNYNTGVWTPPTGFTTRNTANAEIGLASKEQPAAGSSGSVVGSKSGTAQRHCVNLIAVKGASAPTTPPGQFLPFF